VLTSHGGDVREGNVRITKPGVRERHVLAVRTADALISISPFTEDGFRRLHPRASRIVTIPNGIDLDPFEQPASRPSSLDPAIRDGEYALFLGRLSRRKGVDVLLRALAQMPASGKVQLVVAGSGEGRQELEALAGELGITQRLRFVGRVEGEAKIYLLRNALFTVMPSRQWEAFPLVVLESYAAAKPLVGTRIPGVRDLIEEQKTGLLVPEEDPAALADAMQSLFHHHARTEEMGAASKQVVRNYSWSSIARKHLELYEALRSDRGDGRH